MGILVLGVVGTMIASSVLHRRAAEAAVEWLDERAEIVQSETRSTVFDLIEGMRAVAAFMEASEGVSQETFVDFVSRLDERISLIGVAYLPIVPADDAEDFIASMQRTVPNFDITDLGTGGEIVEVDRNRDVYYPVQYFAPSEWLFAELPEGDSPLELGMGVDAGSNDVWGASVDQALETDSAVVSGFIPINFEEISFGHAFVVMAPVHDSVGTPIGVVAAPMIDWLLPTQLDVSITSDLSWRIGSQSEATTSDHAWAGEINLPGTTWYMTAEPDDSAAASLAGTPSWLVWAIGLALTAGIAGLAHLYRLRTRSRARLSEMQRVSEEKDRFLAAVSHEIRTPLTAVAGLAHELSERPDDFDGKEFRSLLGTVAEQSDEVAAIVEDLLVAARSDIGNVSVHHGTIDLHTELALAIETAGVEAEVVGAYPPDAWADAQRVRQILRNLLTNAGRYGGPDIQVRFEANDDTIAIVVADNGIPIPEEQRRRIFEPYTSAHKNTEQVGSIGLGLFISRKLATIMDGSLTYHHDGEWSRFTLSIPRSISGRTALPPSPAELTPGEAGRPERQSA